MNLLSRAKIWCPLSVLERVRIIEGFFFLKKIYESFAGTLETVRNRGVGLKIGLSLSRKGVCAYMKTTRQA